MSYPKTGEEVYVSLNLSNTMLTGLGKGLTEFAVVTKHALS